MKNEVVWLERGLFPIYYGFCPNERAWKKALTNFKVDEPYPTKAHACVTSFQRGNDGAVCCIMTIQDRFDRRSQDQAARAALFAHEAVHIWQAAREAMRERDPSHEFEAYAVQFIMGNLMGAYEKTRLAKPKRLTKRKRRARRSRH